MIKVRCIDRRDTRLVVGRVYDVIDYGDRFALDGELFFKWRFTVLGFTTYLEKL